MCFKNIIRGIFKIHGSKMFYYNKNNYIVKLIIYTIKNKYADMSNVKYI